MSNKQKRFTIFGYPLESLEEITGSDFPSLPAELKQSAGRAKYSIRLLRYWWAGQALRREAARLGRPLTVVDLGCERGWLKFFTPRGVVQRWIGLDWNIRSEVSEIARYDEVHQADFDERLPLPIATADAVVSLHVFEHLLRPGCTMAEVSRLLRAGGIFVGGAPTMPHWIARLREQYFRKRLDDGRIFAGGHITVLSPTRWRSLAEDAGLEVEFATGSHMIRRTGSWLENFSWWIRFNQAWGALFPALGSECCVLARKAGGGNTPVRTLPAADLHWRKLWIGVGVSVAALVVMGGYYANHYAEKIDERAVATWLDAHQTGAEVFLTVTDDVATTGGFRKDLHKAETIDELVHLVARFPQAHVLVSLEMAAKLDRAQPGHWRIDSRFDLGDAENLLIKQSSTGTHLGEYLLGTNTQAF